MFNCKHCGHELGVNTPEACPSCGRPTAVNRGPFGWVALILQLVALEIFGWLLIGLAGFGAAALVYVLWQML